MNTADNIFGDDSDLFEASTQLPTNNFTSVNENIAGNASTLESEDDVDNFISATPNRTISRRYDSSGTDDTECYEYDETLIGNEDEILTQDCGPKLLKEIAGEQNSTKQSASALSLVSPSEDDTDSDIEIVLQTKTKEPSLRPCFPEPTDYEADCDSSHSQPFPMDLPENYEEKISQRSSPNRPDLNLIANEQDAVCEPLWSLTQQTQIIEPLSLVMPATQDFEAEIARSKYQVFDCGEDDDTELNPKVMRSQTSALQKRKSIDTEEEIDRTISNCPGRFRSREAFSPSYKSSTLEQTMNKFSIFATESSLFSDETQCSMPFLPSHSETEISPSTEGTTSLDESIFTAETQNCITDQLLEDKKEIIFLERTQECIPFVFKPVVFNASTSIQKSMDKENLKGTKSFQVPQSTMTLSSQRKANTKKLMQQKIMAKKSLVESQSRCQLSNDYQLTQNGSIFCAPTQVSTMKNAVNPEDSIFWAATQISVEQNEITLNTEEVFLEETQHPPNLLDGDSDVNLKKNEGGKNYPYRAITSCTTVVKSSFLKPSQSLAEKYKAKNALIEEESIFLEATQLFPESCSSLKTKKDSKICLEDAQAFNCADLPAQLYMDCKENNNHSLMESTGSSQTQSRVYYRGNGSPNSIPQHENNQSTLQKSAAHRCLRLGKPKTKTELERISEKPDLTCRYPSDPNKSLCEEVTSHKAFDVEDDIFEACTQVAPRKVVKTEMSDDETDNILLSLQLSDNNEGVGSLSLKPSDKSVISSQSDVEVDTVIQATEKFETRNKELENIVTYDYDETFESQSKVNARRNLVNCLTSRSLNIENQTLLEEKENLPCSDALTQPYSLSVDIQSNNELQNPTCPPMDFDVPSQVHYYTNVSDYATPPYAQSAASKILDNSFSLIRKPKDQISTFRFGKSENHDVKSPTLGLPAKTTMSNDNYNSDVNHDSPSSVKEIDNKIDKKAATGNAELGYCVIDSSAPPDDGEKTDSDVEPSQLLSSFRKTEPMNLKSIPKALDESTTLHVPSPQILKFDEDEAYYAETQVDSMNASNQELSSRANTINNTTPEMPPETRKRKIIQELVAPSERPRRVIKATWKLRCLQEKSRKNEVYFKPNDQSSGDETPSDVEELAISIYSNKSNITNITCSAAENVQCGLPTTSKSVGRVFKAMTNDFSNLGDAQRVILPGRTTSDSDTHESLVLTGLKSSCKTNSSFNSEDSEYAYQQENKSERNSNTSVGRVKKTARQSTTSDSGIFVGTNVNTQKSSDLNNSEQPSSLTITGPFQVQLITPHMSESNQKENETNISVNIPHGTNAECESRTPLSCLSRHSMKTRRKLKMGPAAHSSASAEAVSSSSLATTKRRKKKVRILRSDSEDSDNETREQMRTAEVQTPAVAFATLASSTAKATMTKLGGSVVDVENATVLVCDEFRCTAKTFIAVCRGIPIVHSTWIQESQKERSWLNPWRNLLEDPAAEGQWGFSLYDILRKAPKTKLLTGYSIFVTERVTMPSTDVLRIVELCGGVPLTEKPQSWPKKTIFISSVMDRQLWPARVCRNVKVQSLEFVYTVVLQQKLDFIAHALR